jgi:hypothetical protein
MKYYLCIKDVPSGSNDDITAFIAIAFSNKMVNAKDIDGMYGTRYSFAKGYIYHTSPLDSRFIVDGNHRSHKLSDIEQYFEEFKLEIDEEAQKIIDKKDNDVIQIEPLYLNTNGLITYSIECIHYDDDNNIRRIETSINTSQAEGIIRCYQKIRLRTWQTLNWKEIIHRHINFFVYGKK